MSEAARGHMIYLFSPSKDWPCRGATLICADSLGEAVALGNEHGTQSGERFCFGESTIGACKQKYSSGPATWVFRDGFKLGDVAYIERGVVFSEATAA